MGFLEAMLQPHAMAVAKMTQGQLALGFLILGAVYMTIMTPFGWVRYQTWTKRNLFFF